MLQRCCSQWGASELRARSRVCLQEEILQRDLAALGSVPDVDDDAYGEPAVPKPSSPLTAVAADLSRAGQFTDNAAWRSYLEAVREAGRQAGRVARVVLPLDGSPSSSSAASTADSDRASVRSVSPMVAPPRAGTDASQRAHAMLANALAAAWASGDDDDRPPPPQQQQQAADAAPGPGTPQVPTHAATLASADVGADAAGAAVLEGATAEHGWSAGRAGATAAAAPAATQQPSPQRSPPRDATALFTGVAALRPWSVVPGTPAQPALAAASGKTLATKPALSSAVAATASPRRHGSSIARRGSNSASPLPALLPPTSPINTASALRGGLVVDAALALDGAFGSKLGDAGLLRSLSPSHLASVAAQAVDGNFQLTTLVSPPRAAAAAPADGPPSSPMRPIALLHALSHDSAASAPPSASAARDATAAAGVGDADLRLQLERERAAVRAQVQAAIDARKAAVAAEEAALLARQQALEAEAEEARVERERTRREREESTRRRRQEAAAVMLQAHARGLLARRRHRVWARLEAAREAKRAEDAARRQRLVELQQQAQRKAAEEEAARVAAAKAAAAEAAAAEEAERQRREDERALAAAAVAAAEARAAALERQKLEARARAADLLAMSQEDLIASQWREQQRREAEARRLAAEEAQAKAIAAATAAQKLAEEEAAAAAAAKRRAEEEARAAAAKALAEAKAREEAAAAAAMALQARDRAAAAAAREHMAAEDAAAHLVRTAERFEASRKLQEVETALRLRALEERQKALESMLASLPIAGAALLTSTAGAATGGGASSSMTAAAPAGGSHDVAPTAAASLSLPAGSAAAALRALPRVPSARGDASAAATGGQALQAAAHRHAAIHLQSLWRGHRVRAAIAAAKRAARLPDASGGVSREAAALLAHPASRALGATSSGTDGDDDLDMDGMLDLDSFLPGMAHWEREQAAEAAAAAAASAAGSAAATHARHAELPAAAPTAGPSAPGSLTPQQVALLHFQQQQQAAATAAAYYHMQQQQMLALAHQHQLALASGVAGLSHAYPLPLGYPAHAGPLVAAPAAPGFGPSAWDGAHVAAASGRTAASTLRGASAHTRPDTRDSAAWELASVRSGDFGFPSTPSSPPRTALSLPPISAGSMGSVGRSLSTSGSAGALAGSAGSGDASPARGYRGGVAVSPAPATRSTAAVAGSPTREPTHDGGGSDTGVDQDAYWGIRDPRTIELMMRRKRRMEGGARAGGGAAHGASVSAFTSAYSFGGPASSGGGGAAPAMPAAAGGGAGGRWATGMPPVVERRGGRGVSHADLLAAGVGHVSHVQADLPVPPPALGAGAARSDAGPWAGGPTYASATAARVPMATSPSVVPLLPATGSGRSLRSMRAAMDMGLPLTAPHAASGTATGSSIPTSPLRSIGGDLSVGPAGLPVVSGVRGRP